jgi:hypothetical protein
MRPERRAVIASLIPTPPQVSKVHAASPDGLSGPGGKARPVCGNGRGRRAGVRSGPGAGALECGGFRRFEEGKRRKPPHSKVPAALTHLVGHESCSHRGRP